METLLLIICSDVCHTWLFNIHVALKEIPGTGSGPACTLVNAEFHEPVPAKLVLMWTKQYVEAAAI